jgi:hypothetical protein
MRDARLEVGATEQRIAALREELRRAATAGGRACGRVRTAAVIGPSLCLLLTSVTSRAAVQDGTASRPLTPNRVSLQAGERELRATPVETIRETLRLSRGLGLLKAPVLVEVERSARHERVIRLKRIIARTIGAGGRRASVTEAWASFDSAGKLRRYTSRLRSSRVGAVQEALLERAACSGLAYLFGRRDPPSEFELDVRRTSTGYGMQVSDVPYAPGAFSVVEISRRFRVLSGHGGM